jgi:curved DNA-binding protein CbpA
MSGSTFRGDPYRVLDVDQEASDDEIKRRWRDLAREHHPDRAFGDGDERERLTTRMARINAAYDVLRDPVRRARYDASPEARRARRDGGRDRGGARWTRGAAASAGPGGPPPPPPTRPVTARFDTSAAYLRRNTTLSDARPTLRGQAPIGRYRSRGGPDLRASTPTGPVRRAVGDRPRLPSLEEARDTVLGFGRFHGWTLGQVADHDPTYVDWIASTVTRDRDLVIRARVVTADLDARGVPRPHRGHAEQARAERDGGGVRAGT